MNTTGCMDERVKGYHYGCIQVQKLIRMAVYKRIRLQVCAGIDACLVTIERFASRNAFRDSCSPEIQIESDATCIQPT
jgi:hypothetical protein